MTGHGGEGFLKFQDSKELTSVELADAFEQMWQMRRYHEVNFRSSYCGLLCRTKTRKNLLLPVIA